MSVDYTTLETLRAHHPAWRLLASPHAPLVASFLHRVFVGPNVRVLDAGTLTEALEDELFALRQTRGDDAYPQSAMHYLNDWASPDKGWLRKFYASGSDEPQFDLTPATEKALTWLNTLTQRSFVGTESRLRTLFDLLRQMREGSDADQVRRLDELQRRRNEIDAEIQRVQAGELPLLDETAIKDRFQQFTQLARELLSDFREVEHNFRQLDRRVRERIALWEGAKGDLLEDVMGQRDAITDSDQGRSFRAFWDFLMSPQRQEELSELLEYVLGLDTVETLKPDTRLQRIHYDWLEAGEHTQRTVAQLSHQLRRFLDDQAWLENRRIMEVLHDIEVKALGLRETAPTGAIIDIIEPGADIHLPLERPLYSPSQRPSIAVTVLDDSGIDIDASALYDQMRIDQAGLERNIRQALMQQNQITLRELTASYPLTQGLAELLTYLQLGSEDFSAQVDESISETILWESRAPSGSGVIRQARLPRVIFHR